MKTPKPKAKPALAVRGAERSKPKAKKVDERTRLRRQCLQLKKDLGASRRELAHLQEDRKHLVRAIFALMPPDPVPDFTKEEILSQVGKNQSFLELIEELQAADSLP